jgi:4-amino-4-deoxy-L-arabinose transferase
VLLAALYVLPLVAPFPLLDPDEGLHAAITQEMIARDDWILPRFLGEPFLDKPILFFWAQEVSFRVFGEHEASARLPGLVFGALGALTTGWLAATVLGARGWLAAWLYTTMLVPIALMEVPVHDIAVVPFTNAALLGFWRAARASQLRGTLSWSAAAGVALGLAMLTKGLTGVAIVGIAHGALLLFERRLRPTIVLGGIVALAIGIALAAPWYLAVERVHPGYLHYYFVERHLFGFATETQRHGSRPFLYYVPVLIGGGLPWVVLTPFAWGRLRPGSWRALTASERDAVRLAAVWLGGGWLFLSVAGSKLFTYALPLFPAIALLATVAWESRPASVTTRTVIDRALLILGIAAALFLPLLLIALPREMHIVLPGWAWAASSIVAAGWVTVVVAWSRGRAAVASIAAPLLAAGTIAVLLAGVMPRVGETMSARDLAHALNGKARLPPEVWIIRQRLGSVVFYLSPALRAETTAERLRQVQLADLRARVAPAGTRVAVARRDQARVDPFVRPGASYEQAGTYRIYWAQDLGVALR